jgi:hypothetical protein
MDEIISYKPCAVKVRNAKLRNYLKFVKLWHDVLIHSLTVLGISGKIMFCGPSTANVSRVFY